MKRLTTNRELTYDELYTIYSNNYNGKPKHDYSHFIKVISSLKFHNELIRPKIIWWQTLRITLNKI